MFWSFGREACGILVPLPGIEPTSPALEGEVLTTGPPGKSHYLSLNAALPITMYVAFTKLLSLSVPQFLLP